MLDEFQNNKPAALAVLDEATTTLGDDPVLGRALARVYLRDRDYENALTIFQRISDFVGRNNPIERAFALRDAAICAAENQEWGCAEEWFVDAQSAAGRAGLPDMDAMATGLGVDAGLAALGGGETCRALSRLAIAIDALSEIGSEEGLRAAYCHHAVRHAVLWAYSQVTGSEIDVEGQPIRWASGGCSNPAPAPAIRERPLANIDLTWYLLAEAEVAAGVDVGIVSSLYGRLTDGAIPRMEVGLRTKMLQAAIDKLDALAFAAQLAPYVDSAVYALKDYHGGKQVSTSVLLEPERRRITTLDTDALLDRQGNEVAQHAILAYGIRGAMASRENATTELNAALAEEFQRLYPGQPVIDHWEVEQDGLSGIDKSALMAIQRLAGKEYVKPEDFWSAGLRFFEWIERSLFGEILMLRLAAWQRKGWKRIVTAEKFRLYRPRYTVPEVKEVLRISANGRSFVARLLLTTSHAIGSPLSLEYRKALEAVAEQETSSN